MSVRDEQVFSLVAANGLREKDDALADNVVTVSDQLDLVKTAVVYGANASGKSNLLRALDFFIDSIVLSSPTGSAVGPYSPFVLDQQTAEEPTLLEAVFVVEGLNYRYGFEVHQQVVISEWLFIRRKQETYVFERTTNELRVNRQYKKIQELQSNGMVSQTALLLKLGSLFNDETCQVVQNWAASVRYIEGTEDYQWRSYTVQFLEDPIDKQKILNLLQGADFGIEDIVINRRETKTPAFNLIIDGKQKLIATERAGFTYDIETVRLVWDEKTKQLQRHITPINLFESQGTIKFFNLIGLILLKLENGSLLIADELDTKLHPLLTQRIVQLFNSPVTNPRNAQFIFATHDTNLLSAGLFRRDQIWFTEKDAKGGTEIYALTDYKPGGKTVRNDEQLEKNYIAGKYGGIPFLGNFDALFDPQPSSSETIAHE